MGIFDSVTPKQQQQQDTGSYGIFGPPPSAPSTGIFSPAAQGLLAAGLGALASRGNTMQAIGRGGLLGLSAYGQAQQADTDQQKQMWQWNRQQQALGALTPDASGVINASPAQLMAAGFSDPAKWDHIRNAGRDKVKEYGDVRNPDGTITRTGFGEYGGTFNTGAAPAKELTNVNGVATDLWGARPGQVLAQDPNKPFSTGQDGMPVANSAYQNYELNKAAAGAARTNLSVNTAPKAFWGDHGKQLSNALFEEQKVAQGAASTLQNITEIRKAADGGAFQGAGADLKLSAAKALSGMGFQISPEQIKNSEQFNAIANNFVLDRVKTLGANPSNADREFIEKTVPRLSTDPGALPLLLDFMESKARSQIDGYNQKVRGVESQPEARYMPYSMEVPYPSGVAVRIQSNDEYAKLPKGALFVTPEGKTLRKK